MSKFIHTYCAEHKDCWLSDHMDGYLIHLRLEGYSHRVVQSYARVLVSFASFAREQGAEQTDQLHEWIESFGEHESNPTSKESACKIITDFIGYLQMTGVLQKAKMKARLFSRTLSEYEVFLREIRGLKHNSITKHTSYCDKFLRYLRDSGVNRVRSANQDLIARFVIAEASRYARKTMVNNCVVLRKFLSYLHSKGRIRKDLSAVIAIPRLYKHERCPRFLNRAEIEHVLDSVDRSILLSIEKSPFFN